VTACRLLPSASMRTLISSISLRSICSPCKQFGIAGVVDSTFCSIWRTITSMCLSLMLTPCRVDLLDFVHQIGRKLLGRP